MSKRGYTSVKLSIHCWACINPPNLCQMRFSSILSAKCEALMRKCAERPPKPECWPRLRDHDWVDHFHPGSGRSSDSALPIRRGE